MKPGNSWPPALLRRRSLPEMCVLILYHRRERRDMVASSDGEMDVEDAVVVVAVVVAVMSEGAERVLAVYEADADATSLRQMRMRFCLEVEMRGEEGDGGMSSIMVEVRPLMLRPDQQLLKVTGWEPVCVGCKS